MHADYSQLKVVKLVLACHHLSDLITELEKIMIFKIKKIILFNHIFLKFVLLHQGFTKFLKLVCLLNHINNMAIMLLLFPVTLLLS